MILMSSELFDCSILIRPTLAVSNVAKKCVTTLLTGSLELDKLKKLNAVYFSECLATTSVVC